MPKARNRGKKSGYYIQPVQCANKKEQEELLTALAGINERTPKTKQFTANALRLQKIYGSSINILKKLRKTGYAMQSIIGQ